MSEIHDLEASSPALRCRIFGHKFDYEVIEDTDEKTVIDATCRRSSCNYHELLTEDSFNV